MSVRLIFLAALTMCAFAANSVLNRLALADAGMDPASFAIIRTVAGAVALALLLFFRGRPDPARRVSRWGVASLTLYMLGFSFAYVSLAAGTGALILFGGVQVTMFAGTLVARQRVTTAQALGAALAFAGLVVLVLPGSAGAPDPLGSLLMVCAALGWGVYSLIGRSVSDPLAATRDNFVYAMPLVALAAIAFVEPASVTEIGIALAVTAGALTSGVGYAMWYRTLPHLEAPAAAVLQLTVPLIAAAGGIAFLAEPITGRFVVTGALVAAGVLLAISRRRA